MKNKYFRMDIAKHLSKSVFLEESGVPVIMRMVIIFGASIVLLFLIWASIASVDEVAIASGEIVPEGKIMKIQHWKGGIVQEILARDGDVVTSGQILIKLEPFVLESEFALTRTRFDALQAQKERLEALCERRDPNFDHLDLKNKAIMTEQLNVHRQILKSWRASRGIIEEQIKQVKTDMSAQNVRKEKLDKSRTLLKIEIDVRDNLRKLIQYTTIDSLSLTRMLIDFEGGLQEAIINRDKSNYIVSELNKRLDELDQKIIDALTKELADVSIELIQTQAIMKKNGIAFDLNTLRAPVDGIVHGLKVHTIGGVIQPGNVIMEIVPENKKLCAEVNISNRDIGHVRLGQAVDVKFTTYNFMRYGGIKGKLMQISPTTFSDRGGTSYYRAIVGLEQEHLGADPRQNPILPGMTVQADIKTGSKTIMEYLLKPIYTSVNQAMRER